MPHEDIYVKTKELTELLKNSDEYIQFKRIKDNVLSSPTNKELIGQFKRLQFEAQTTLMAGKEVSPEVTDKLQKLSEVLQFNSEITAYFMAEYHVQSLVSEVYKMIGEACETGAEFFDGTPSTKIGTKQ